MIKLIEAFWILEKIDFHLDKEEYNRDFFKVRIFFETTLSGGGESFVLRIKGLELENLLRELTGPPVQGNFHRKLKACRKKPVLLVTDGAGNIKTVLPR